MMVSRSALDHANDLDALVEIVDALASTLASSRILETHVADLLANISERATALYRKRVGDD